jgi:hypothetical protein
MIEYWERVRFDCNKAVSWQKSFDHGKTWVDVEWWGGEIPFVRITWDGDDSVEMVRSIRTEEVAK